jgi:hypothetical protein
MVSFFAPVFEPPMPSGKEASKKVKGDAANGKTGGRPRCYRFTCGLKKEHGKNNKQQEQGICFLFVSHNEHALLFSHSVNRQAILLISYAHMFVTEAIIMPSRALGVNL